MLTAATLAVATHPDTGSGPGVVSAYYLAAIAGETIAGLAALGGVVLGVRKWYLAKRSKWTDEGTQRQKHVEAMEANTRAAQENTKAIGSLAGKFGGFAEETRTTLLEHGGRLDEHGRRLDEHGRLLDRLTDARIAGQPKGGTPSD